MAWRTFASSNDGLVAGLVKEEVCSVWAAEKMRLVDRAWFVKVQPYTDAPQLLGFGQTISAPHMHAYALDMLRHVLDRKDDAKIDVLDVGAGSGYFCALLLAANEHVRVLGIEIVPELVELASANLKNIPKQWQDRVVIEHGSGWKPLKQGPFDAIHVGAAAETLPKALMQNLKIGGTMVCPVGRQHETQHIMLVKRVSENEFEEQKLLPVSYVPLVDKELK